MPLGPKSGGAAPVTRMQGESFSGASGQASGSVPANTPMPPTEWEASFVRQGVPPHVAKLAGGYIERGMDPATALHVVYGLGLDKTPETEWETFAREQPIRANTKKLLNISGSNLKELTKPIHDALPNPAHEQEKLSAAKMLKEYLLHQDMQRAEEMKKQGMWQMVHDAQVQDQFYVDNKRPPASLGDFALAGMNYRPAPVVEQQTPAPKFLPGEIMKTGGYR